MTMEWPDDQLADYGPMLTVRDVAAVLRIQPGRVRELLVHPSRDMRLPGVKLGSWRVPRSELRTYLIAHHTTRAPEPSNERLADVRDH